MRYINEGLFSDDDPVDVGIYDPRTENVYIMKEGKQVVSVPYNVLRRGLKGVFFEAGPDTTEGWYDWAKGWRESQGPGPRKETLGAMHRDVRPANWENTYQGFVQAVRDAGVDLAMELMPQGKAVHGFAAFLGIARKAKNAKRAAQIVRGAEKAIDRHHQLPQQFRKVFERAGLNIEEYTIDMTRLKHRLKPTGLHTGSESWNKVWGTFFKEAGENVTREQILNQLSKMRKDFGLE